MLYAADYPFWKAYHREIVGVFRGELWTVSAQARDAYGLYWLRHSQNQGFCLDRDAICGGGNSGYQAVHLAATFGASKIVLLGFDMQRTGGRSHSHGDHVKPLGNGSNFSLWIERFGPLARDLKARGVDVVNASRTTALRCFRQASLEEALP